MTWQFIIPKLRAQSGATVSPASFFAYSKFLSGGREFGSLPGRSSDAREKMKMNKNLLER